MLWTALVTIAYFVKADDIFKSFNPNLNFFYVIVYFLSIATSGGIFVLLIKMFDTKKLRAWHLVASVLLFSIMIASLTQINSYKIYNGEPIIKSTDAVITYEDIILKTGQVLSLERIKSLGLAPEIESQFVGMPFFEGTLNITKNLSLEFAKLLLLLISLYSAGGLFSKLFFKGERTLITHLGTFGLGTLTLSLILFFLAKLSFFNGSAVIAVLSVFLLAGLKELRNLFKDLWTASIKIRDLSYPALGSIYILLVFAAWNFIESAEPMPIGFDDASLYLNLPNLIAHFQEFLHGFPYYSFSLIQSIGPLLDENGALEKTLIYAFGLLALLPLYSLLREYFNQKLSVLGSLLFFTTPIIFIHNFLQLKVEMPLFFFASLSLLFIHFYLKEKLNKWLILSALFTGFAISIKATAIILSIALIFILLTRLFKWLGSTLAILLILFGYFFSGFNFIGDVSSISTSKILMILMGALIIINLGFLLHRHSFKTFKPLIIFLIFLALPVLPWAGSNYISGRDISANGLLFDLQTEGPEINSISYCSSDSGSTVADYERYITKRDNPITTLLLMPWDTTINNAGKSILMNIGFLFLAFCPLALYYFKKLPILLSGGIFFWILWALIAKGVIWYGIAGFGFLMLSMLFGIQKLTDTEGKIIKGSTYALLCLAVVTGFFYRSNLYISRAHTFIPYFNELASYETYANNVYPEYQKMADIINVDKESKVYLTDNAFLNYFITGNSKRVFRDQFLDVYGCIEESGNSLEILRSEFDYLVISKPVFDPDFPEELYTMSLNLLTLAQENFTYLWGNADTYLFEIR